MFSFLLSLRGMAVAGVLAFALGASGGFYVAQKIGQTKVDALIEANYRATIEMQEKNLEIIAAVQDADDVLAEANAARIAELEKVADVLKTKISDGSCLAGPDTDWLRDFFDKSAR